MISLVGAGGALRGFSVVLWGIEAFHVWVFGELVICGNRRLLKTGIFYIFAYESVIIFCRYPFTS